MLEKKIIFMILFMIFSLIAIISMNSSFDEGEKILVKEGKNDISFNISNPFYVKTLVKLNPEIEAVSFVENNKTVGYVNIFGGIGRNFAITNQTSYEIILPKDDALILPH